MRLCEIDVKYFNLFEGVVELLEKYSSPATELTVSFRTRAAEHGVYYFEAVVYESGTGDKVLSIDFSLNENNPNEVSLNNIYPLKVDVNKISYTSLGSQFGTAADMGYSAMKWVYQELANHAKMLGFDIKKIVSSTRISGSGARNNMAVNDDQPKHFSVDLNLKETFIYDCTKHTLIKR
jgi:hypothetical protein